MDRAIAPRALPTNPRNFLVLKPPALEKIDFVLVLIEVFPRDRVSSSVLGLEWEGLLVGPWHLKGLSLNPNRLTLKDGSCPMGLG